MNDFITNYSDFILHVKNIFPDNNLFEKLLDETPEEKINRFKKFNDLLNNTTLFNHFVKNKIKLFSHKDKSTLDVSESIFGSEITLKKIFNNQDESVKLLFWSDLKSLLLSYNYYILSIDPDDKKAQEKIQNLEKKPVINPKDGLDKILKTENLNQTTNNMINDIFSTFEETVEKPGSNPFSNIMQISQTISEKYKTNIENGEVNLDDLLKNMTGLPGMENISNIVGSITKQIQPTETIPAEKVIIDEEFSTAIVQKGEQTEDTSNFNVGELLKTMDSFGALGFTNPFVDGKIPDENNMNKLMNVFNKLSSTENPSQLNEIFENDLGINMDKFTNEMNKVLGKNE